MHGSRIVDEPGPGAFAGSMQPAWPRHIMNVCCVGAGHVGGPTCAVIASKCPHIQVSVVDLDQDRVAAWNSDCLPIYEPQLSDFVLASRDGRGAASGPNLFFSTNVAAGIAAADLIFISVDTPTKLSGLDSGSALDISRVESVARTIASVSTTNKIVVEKSTVPCRTADVLRDILVSNGRPGVQFKILSNPEFLAEGTAMTNLLSPDRVLIGSLEADFDAAKKLAEIYSAWVPRSRIITTNLWSAELSKLSANAFLAQRISSINALSAVCEATNADICDVSHAIGLDQRIGPCMLQQSVGFGGSCFKKDVLCLVYLSRSLNLHQVADYWQGVIAINDWQKARFVRRILRGLNDTLTDKRIAVLGFAYKKDTSDHRESAAISVLHALVKERARVSVYDPQVPRDRVLAALRVDGVDPVELEEYATVALDPYKACEDAHAVVILTDWDEFRGIDETGSKRLDWARIASRMRKPSFVFDGRGIVNVPALQRLGIRVESIGRKTAPL